MNEAWLTAKKIFNLKVLPTLTSFPFHFITYLGIVKIVLLL